MNYMGIDGHRQYSPIILLNEKGKVVKSGRVADLRRELEEEELYFCRPKKYSAQ